MFELCKNQSNGESGKVLLTSQDSDDSDVGVDYETALERTGYGRLAKHLSK